MAAAARSVTTYPGSALRRVNNMQAGRNGTFYVRASCAVRMPHKCEGAFWVDLNGRFYGSCISRTLSAAEAPSPVMDNPIAARAATMIRVIDIDTPSLLVDIPSATTGVDAAETCYAQASNATIAFLKPSLCRGFGPFKRTFLKFSLTAHEQRSEAIKKGR